MSDENKTPAIEVHNLTASYNRNTVSGDLVMKLPKGTLIGIVGE